MRQGATDCCSALIVSKNFPEFKCIFISWLIISMIQNEFCCECLLTTEGRLETVGGKKKYTNPQTRQTGIDFRFAKILTTLRR
jgi:hypothetical protein